jgi:hypothetical protein
MEKTHTSLASPKHDGLFLCRRCYRRQPLDKFEVNAAANTGRSRVCQDCTHGGIQQRRGSFGSEVSTCRTCKQSKPIGEFYRRWVRGSSAITAQCAACALDRLTREHTTEDNKPRVERNRKTCNSCHSDKPINEFHVVKNRPDWHADKCIECSNERKRLLKEHTPQRVWREQNLRRKYGIGIVEFDAMVVAQRGACAICGETLCLDPSSRGHCNVDHDHTTGAVRAILCHPCNTKLGALESPGFLNKAIQYLQKHGSDSIKGDFSLC